MPPWNLLRFKKDGRIDRRTEKGEREKGKEKKKSKKMMKKQRRQGRKKRTVRNVKGRKKKERRNGKRGKPEAHLKASVVSLKGPLGYSSTGDFQKLLVP